MRDPAALPPTSLRHVDQNIRTAQTQFWDAAVERQLGNGNVVSLQYTAARGVHLYDIKNYNALGGANIYLGAPYTDPISGNDGRVRFNQQFSNINNRGSNGDSYYEAMNVQFQSTNFRHTGVSLVANYTLGHATDDLSTTFSETSFGNLGYTNPFNPGFDHGNSDLDIRHRFVLAPIYRTPGVHGNGLLTQLVGGWQISGIYTVRTGTPFTYFDSTNNATGYQVARYTPAAGAVPQRTFKSIPKGQDGGGSNIYTIGSLPAADPLAGVNDAIGGVSDWGPFPSTMTARNAFRGPGAWNVDALVSKTFPIHESVNLELRAEGFNVFNHHNLYIQGADNDIAGTGAGDILAQKGGITGVGDERRFGQFAAKINF